jgi:hypothetical protein
MSKDDALQNVVTGVAEAVGGALGSIAGQVDAIKAEHPHPVEEVRGVIADGQARAATMTRTVKKRAKTAVKTTKKTVKRLTRRGAKVVKKASRKVAASRTRVVKKARKTANKARKAAKKAAARRARGRRR